MKKILCVLLALAMVFALCACGKSSKMSAEDESAFCADFTDKLYAISQNYHPGTAGCSLTGAELAAEIMDVFTQFKPTAELVKKAFDEFKSSLDADAQANFTEQLSGIAGAFTSLSGENAEGLLSDCGYTGEGKWDISALTPLFDAFTK